MEKTKKSTPVEGIAWPITPQGNRSTTYTSKQAFATSIQSIDSQAAELLIKEKNWRYGYEPHIITHVSLAAKNADNALTIAKNGLEYLYSKFQFVRGDRCVPLSDAPQLSDDHSFHTATVRGTKPRPGIPKLNLPCKGKQLSGSSFLKQLEKWSKQGTIEPSVVTSLRELVENSSEWLDLSGRHFVIMGAGAAMGPFQALLELGADIIAIDLDKPQVWKRLIKMAQESCGSITFPVREDYQTDVDERSIDDLAEIAGCNLLTQTPEICNWLVDVFPESQLTVGGYCYLDGEAHVRVSLAMDLIMKHVVENRPNSSIAFLCSPTDVFAIPQQAHAAANKRYHALTLSKLWQKPLEMLSRGRCLNNHSVGAPGLKDEHGFPVYLANNIITQQGPNYILAKRLQQWRFIVARHKGWKISANVAPASYTPSVMSNSLLAAGYGGVNHFKPVEIFSPDTANTIMTALLIYDVNSEIKKEAPTYNPMDLFKNNAVHGGVWHLAFRLGSVNEVAAVLYWIEKYHLKPLMGIVSLGAITGVVRAKL